MESNAIRQGYPLPRRLKKNKRKRYTKNISVFLKAGKKKLGLRKIPFGSWRKFFLIFAVLAISLVSGVYIIALVNRPVYERFILENLQRISPVPLDLRSTQFRVFPSPIVRLSDFRLFRSDNKETPFFKAETLDIQLSWFSLLKNEFTLESLRIDGGKFILEKDEYGKFFPENEGQVEAPKGNLAGLRIQQIEIKNSEIKYSEKKDLKQTHTLNISEFTLNLEKEDKQADFDFSGSLNNEKLEVKGKGWMEKKEGADFFRSLRFHSKIKTGNLPLYLIRDYLGIFTYANFYTSNVSMDVSIEKKNEEDFYFTGDVSLQNFSLKGGNSFPRLFVNGAMIYNYAKDKYTFQKSTINWEGLIRGSGSGNLDLGGRNSFLKTTGSAEYVNFQAVLWLIKLFNYSIPGKKTTGLFYADYEFNINNVKMYDYKISQCYLKMSAEDNDYTVQKLQFRIYDGEIVSTGTMSFGKTFAYQFESILNGLDIQKVIAQYSEDKYITGRLNGALKFSTHGILIGELLRNISLNGNLHVTNGELLGYANILKPIAAFGKLINFLGPKGKSTEFSDLNLALKIQSEEVQFHKITLKGVGLDIEGKGILGYDKEIDMLFVASLGGIVGKAIRVPVIYKGVMPKNWAYLDPIWVAAVAAGSIFLAGPAGSIAGGIAGSALSEYLRSAWENFNSLFSSGKTKKKQKKD